MGLEFQHPKYRAFFERMLCRDGETLAIYADLFDLGPVPAKRSAFARIRTARLNQLVERFGRVCMLRFAPDCNVASGLCLDHLVPLSSNKLNRELLAASTFHDADGNFRKAPTESFGSNGSRNLILACTNCNSFKQNKFLDSATVARALRYGL
jgi:hypothetical protein